MNLPLRAQALLDAVRDVVPAGSGGGLHSITNASAWHRAVFEAYVQSLRTAKQIADGWWQGIIDTEALRTGDRREAEINVRLRRPAGAVVHPFVVHTIRYFWIECLRINHGLPGAEWVAPEAFVLLWLVESGEGELAAFVATLPYWPMGMDEDGNWI